MQRALFSPSGASWTATPVHELPKWPEHGRVAIDTETHDPQLEDLGPGEFRGARIVGVSFAIEDGAAHYLPIGHSEGNLDPDKVYAYLEDNLAPFRGTLVGANLPYDLGMLASWGEFGIVPNAKWYRDVLVAEPLIDELQQRYSLAAVAGRHHLPGKDEGTLREAARLAGVDPKRGLWQLPASCVGEYATQDAVLPLSLLRRQERIIEEQDLQRVWDMESRLLPALVRMRRRGVRVSMSRLDEFERWAAEEERISLAEVATMSALGLASGDLWTPGALARVIESWGVKVPRTPKNDQPSVTDHFLDGIRHPAADHLRRARRLNKARCTFVKQVREHAVGDRIHAEFHQLRRSRDEGDDSRGSLGARFGRLSLSSPNLQQQPARDPEIGPRWRSIYIPEDGERWASCDYSQQEPRWMIHYAEAAKCPGGAEAAERYRQNPNLDSHDAMAALIRPGWALLPTEEKKAVRDRAKIIALGLAYNMGEAKLCRSLGLPTTSKSSRGKTWEAAGPEGLAVLDEFHRGAPFLRDLISKCRSTAETYGYLVTEFGRRLRFPQKPGGGYDWTSLALNRLIQGTSGDQVKIAIPKAIEAGLPVSLQVHDELDMSFADDRQVRDLARIMLDAVPCRVPHRVDSEVGPSWGELEPMK